MGAVTFNSDKETDSILSKLKKGEISGFIREAIKAAARKGMVRCQKMKARKK